MGRSALFVFVLFFAFGFGLWVSQSQKNFVMPDVHVSQEFESHSEDVERYLAQADSDVQWAVSGFLPEKPNTKVYVTIKGRLIESVTNKKPVGVKVIETEHFIFPGLVDMHNHVKYNVLPLWSDAKGQFLNRFEWRKKYAPYKDAVSYNMKPIKGDTVCAAVRWAEMKALIGGATSMQGIGNDSKCASIFGIHNIEIPGEYGSREKIRAVTDMITPDYIAAVYNPRIAPLIQKLEKEMKLPARATEAQRRAHQRKVYDAALLALLEETQITDWLSTFRHEPRNLANAFHLTIGSDLNIKKSATTEEEFDEFVEKIKKHVTETYGLNEKAANKQIDDMRIWIFGKAGKGGYFQTEPAADQIEGLALIEDSKSMDFFGKGGVISVDKKVRRYLAMYEVALRRSVLKYLDSPEAMALIAHLAEGQRGDSYNRLEYSYISKLGMNQKGLVLIHAVGLSEEDLKDVKAQGISLVWSPFSNLLLYGETLDISLVNKLKINTALGADWTPTGSKNMLDELKIARRYLDKKKISKISISDKDLVNMATINAAKALKLDRVIGAVEAGFQADLMLISRDKFGKLKNPYSVVVQAEQQDVGLVVVSGQPIYGDVPAIESASEIFGDQEGVELLPLNQEACSFKKAFRSPVATPYDLDLEKRTNGQSNFRWVSGLNEELQGKFAEYRAQVRANEPKKERVLIPGLDPLFRCEDNYYQSEFNAFVEKTIDDNLKTRPARRNQSGLDDTWSPLNTGGDIESESDEM